MLLSGQEYVDMYATSMKDRILAAAKTKARELQEAARPGTAAKELEEALDAAEGKPRLREPRIDDAAADIDETTPDGGDGDGHDGHDGHGRHDDQGPDDRDVPPGERAAS
jgi:1-acyl-sn-glycerol-3-phosphate acyltransferase